MLYLIFFISPMLTSAKIAINVTVNSTDNNINLTYSGHDNKIVTNLELNLFNVTTAKLNKGIRIEMGRVPNDVFVKDPTFYGEIFKEFEWEPMQRNLRVNRAKIVDILNEDVVLSTHEYINNTTIPLNVTKNLYTNVENTAQSSWFLDGLPYDDIFYDINFNYGYGKLIYENKWRNTSLHYSKASIGVAKIGLLTIKPLQTVVTKLTATKTILIIEVEYIARLSGAIVANYAEVYGKYHFWAPSVKSIMKAAGMKNEIYTKELIEIRCYLNPRLSIHDKLTGAILEPIKKKLPLMRIMRNKLKNKNKVLYTKFKKPKQQKKKK